MPYYTASVEFTTQSEPTKECREEIQLAIVKVLKEKEVIKMKQLSLAYQEPYTEPSITHIQTRKSSSHKLSLLGKQRISALILLVISIVIPVITADATLSIILSPLALGLLFSKQLHMTFNNKFNNKKVGNK